MTNISAVDPDLPPFTAPFLYELQEDHQMKGKWKLEPNYGTVAGKLILLNVSITN